MLEFRNRPQSDLSLGFSARMLHRQPGHVEFGVQAKHEVFGLLGVKVALTLASHTDSIDRTWNDVIPLPGEKAAPLKVVKRVAEMLLTRDVVRVPGHALRPYVPVASAR
jgi:hypothetical protein